MIGTATQYDKNKAASAAASRAHSAAGRNIGKPPKVKNGKRRKSCESSFRKFCETYLSARFTLAWSPDHLKAIAKIEDAVLRGGCFGYALPRGSGKTTLAIAAALWALLYGHKRYVVLIGSTEAAAAELLDSLKVEIETNDLLLADFPAVCHPVRKLERIGNRAPGQTINGVHTRIEWTDKAITLPTVKGAPSSGAVAQAAGLTGRIRGMSRTTANGTSIRPDLVVIDDPQTDESARSPSQNATRERLLTGAVLGLAGPGKKISAVMPTTIIAPGDMADRVLDRDRHPEWQGERAKLLYAEPTNKELWDRYATLRADGLRAGDRGQAATNFYMQNRAEMDAGAAPGWPQRHNPDELSAVQNAMNLKIDNPRAFAAEYQNDPLAEDQVDGIEALDCDAVCTRLNRVPRGTVPAECNRLTAFLDLSGKVVWYAVVGWTSGFAGHVVDYGAVPKQPRSYWTQSDAAPNLESAFPGVDESGRVYAGLRLAVAEVVGRPYPRQGGGDMKVERCLIDSGWLGETVHQFIRQSPFSALLTASRGYGIGAARAPMSTWQPKPGDVRGREWIVRPGPLGRVVMFDANSWKSFAAQRLLAPEGSAGAMMLCGDDRAIHQLLADHLASEYRTRTTGMGRTVDEWQCRPDNRENHLWDAIVGNCVAASVLGTKWDSGAAAGEPAPPPKPRVKVKLSDLYRQKAALAGRV